VAPTLQSLLQQLTPQQAFQLLLTYYQTAGYPTTAWEQGGPDIARNQATAQALSSALANYVPAIAGGSLLDYAPNFPGWTQLTASEVYNLPVNSATFTQGNISAVNASAATYSYSPSSPLIAIFQDSGNRYFSQGSGSIAPSATTAGILFQAEFAGSKYADPSNSANLRLVSPSLPGVTLTNPSTNYSGVTHTGSGTGTITLGGSPVGAHAIVLNITATSATAPVSASYQLDGAAPVSLGIISSVTNLAGLGINVTLNNGASGTSWVNGDTYSFSTPAPWITSQGADLESDTALAGRSRLRWPSLSAIPTTFLYVLLAKSTPGVGAQVTQAFVAPDPNVNNKINVIVAGPGGVLPPATIALVQAFISPYSRLCDNPVVGSPTTTPITIAATIYGAASQATAIDAAARTAYNNYIASIAVNGTIKLSDLEVLVKPNPLTGVGGVGGVTDIQNLTINGVAANLTLGSPTTFVLPAYPPTLNLTYVLS
jgi:hypothetical protein